MIKYKLNCVSIIEHHHLIFMFEKNVDFLKVKLDMAKICTCFVSFLFILFSYQTFSRLRTIFFSIIAKKKTKILITLES